MSFPFILLYASIKSWVNRESQDSFHQLYLFTQERMKVICALSTHKKFLIWKTCWTFSVLMFQVIKHFLIVIDFWILLVNENFNNFFRSFYWKVYVIIEIVNEFLYSFSPIQKSMTNDYNINFYLHSNWIFRYFWGLKTIVNVVFKSFT